MKTMLRTPIAWMVLCFVMGCGSAGTGSDGGPNQRSNDGGTHVAGPCTDGVDCYCDCVEGSDRGDGFANDACEDKHVPVDPDLALCEDFELASLDQNGGSGWSDQWPGVVNGCHNGRADFANEVEGTCANCCVNVVKNDACEVSGQTGCVLDGAQAMGRRFLPGQTMGIVGERSLPTGQHFGATVAVKFSRNFVNAESPKKTTEFGLSGHCPFGCSSGNQVSRTAGSPFGGVIFTTGELEYETFLGQVRNVDNIAIDWAATPSSYDFGRDHGIDEWHCWKVHIANIGQENATIRHWIDDELLVHVENVDLSTMTNPFDSILLNHYYNDGYPGADIAYRYEDNYHITLGPEPASCAQVGVSESE